MSVPKFLFALFLCCFRFYIPHMGEITWFSTLYLVPLSAMISRPTQGAADGGVSSCG